jgi:hypothetical protein
MTIIETDADESRSLGIRNWIFWLTLFVTTMLVVLTAYVLRDAFLPTGTHQRRSERHLRMPLVNQPVGPFGARASLRAST